MRSQMEIIVLTTIFKEISLLSAYTDAVIPNSRMHSHAQQPWIWSCAEIFFSRFQIILTRVLAIVCSMWSTDKSHAAETTQYWATQQHRLGYVYAFMSYSPERRSHGRWEWCVIIIGSSCYCWKRIAVLKLLTYPLSLFSGHSARGAETVLLITPWPGSIQSVNVWICIIWGLAKKPADGPWELLSSRREHS